MSTTPDQDESPLKLDRSKLIALPLALLFAAVAAAAAAGGTFQALRTQAASVEPLTAKVEAHDKALSNLATDMAVMKNDVGWIRSYLSKAERAKDKETDK